jgi:pimeloyl-ACP methyl ester carboxylesterase
MPPSTGDPALMATVLRKRCAIHYSVWGEGPPLLLLSGWGNTAEEAWGRLLPNLIQRYTVIAVDNRGTPRSPHPMRMVSINTMADDAVAVLDDLGITAAHVMGSSLGGMIAQSIASRHPQRAASMVLLSTTLGTPSYPLHPMIIVDGIRELAVRIAGGKGTPGPRFNLAQLLSTVGWCGIRMLPLVTAPTLVIHGARDHVIPRANARTIARLVRNGRLLVVWDAGHLLIDDAFDEVLGAITTFMDGIVVAESGGSEAA